MTRIYLTILVVILLAHGIGLFNGFTWDDHSLIPKSQNASITDAFINRDVGSSSDSGAYYRPLRTMLFIAITALPGPQVIYMHFMSIVLHFFVAVVLFLLCFKISKSKGVSLVCTLLFSVHPLTTNAVAGISQIKEILSTLFVLAAIHNLLLTGTGERSGFKAVLYMCVYTILGLLSKETAIVIAPLALAALFIYRENWRAMFKYSLVPALLITALYGLVILVIVPGPEKAEYILFSKAITFYTTCGAFIKYFELIVLPVHLSVRHDIPWITTFFDWHVMVTVSVILLLILIMIYLIKKKDQRVIALAFFLISLLPISNIVPIIGHIMSERYLYMPLSALFMLIASFFPVKRFNERNLILLSAPFLLLLMVLTIDRTLDWKNTKTLMEEAVKVAPDSLVVRMNLFDLYKKQNESNKASSEYMEMIRINVERTYKHVEFAKIFQNSGKIETAEKVWEKAEFMASGNPPLLKYVRSERAKITSTKP